jgi:tetraacyldisaccharide 4'-kinase
MSLDARLQSVWYGPAWRSLPLWPLALIFRVLTGLRASLYRIGVLRAQHVGVPVIVVGNLTVGGTGKTPVAQWVARQLTARGWRVGVVLRGYGGSHRGGPRVVTAADAASIVGDEAVLHAQQGAHIVVIGADRVAAGRLAAEQGAEVIVCDDGLQHARLARDYEIAVVDGARGLGNSWLLPAGPLREPASRLESVQAVVLTDRGAASSALELNLRGPLQLTARFALGNAVNLLSGEKRPLRQFAGVSQLHAVAGIGNPAAFFDALRAQGLDVQAHALPDHAALDPAALSLPQDAIVLMTAKDAVKCAGIARPGWWWVELDLDISRPDATILLESLLARTGLTGAGVALG